MAASADGVSTVRLFGTFFACVHERPALCLRTVPRSTLSPTCLICSMLLAARRICVWSLSSTAMRLESPVRRKLPCASFCRAAASCQLCSVAARYSPLPCRLTTSADASITVACALHDCANRSVAISRNQRRIGFFLCMGSIFQNTVHEIVTAPKAARIDSLQGIGRESGTITGSPRCGLVDRRLARLPGQVLQNSGHLRAGSNDPDTLGDLLP
jgi:hypothetical protein